MGSRLGEVAVQIVGTCMLAAGLVLVWLPIPFGGVLIVAGLMLLVASSPTVESWVRRRRQASPRLDDILDAVQSRLPLRVRHVLERTDPNETPPRVL